MVAAANTSDRQTAVGFTFRWSPAINAIRDQIGGPLGQPVHFVGRYWCDYGCDPRAPMSWRYKGGPGSGALADIGSHLVDLAEFVCGPISSVRGAVLSTMVSMSERCRSGAAVGHAATAHERCDRAGGERGRRDVHRDLRDPEPPPPCPHPALRTAIPMLWASSCSPNPALRRSTSNGPVSSASSTVRQQVQRRGIAKCWSGRLTRTSPKACRWTSPASATGRTTCSPSRLGLSCSRWRESPGSLAARRSPTGLHNLRVEEAVVASAASGGTEMVIPELKANEKGSMQ